MSYFSKRPSLKQAFASAAMSLALGGYAAYAHVVEDRPNPMAVAFAGIFAALSGSAFKQHRLDMRAPQQNAEQDVKNTPAPKP